jgi:hypothetical protein
MADGTGGAGGALGIGRRLLQGDSPLKAFVGQKSTDLKDTTVGKVKEAIGGGGGGGKGGGVKGVNIVEALDVGVRRPGGRGRRIRRGRGRPAPRQEERLGTALTLLDERMTALLAAHGLRREDLGPDPGPLGILPPDDTW